jgi:hypothetical protein
MKNLSDHTDLPYALLPSLPISGIRVGQISKLGWLMGLVKHVIMVDSSYFLYLLVFLISKVLAPSQLGQVELVLIFSTSKCVIIAKELIYDNL